MIALQERSGLSAPATYQQWLDCFQQMKQQPLSCGEIYEAAARGTFSGTGAMVAALERQLVETVNAVLNKSVKRFLRELNEAIAFNELDRVPFLFKRFRKDVHKSLFFMELSFLSGDFREELYTSVCCQMQGFWDDTLGFLRRQAMECTNSELEDAIYLIRRIKLFSK